MTWIIIGLGNPGEAYERTRHNTGREAVELFIAAHGGVSALHKKMNAASALVTLGKGKKAQEALCLLPNTFMNKSGITAQSAVKSKKAAERLIVVQDDIDLPSGTLRIVKNRGSGGHRGVENIMRALGTKNFIRIRVGVAKASAKGKALKPKTEDAVVDYILKPIPNVAYDAHKKNLARAAEALETIIIEGLPHAMNTFN